MEIQQQQQEQQKQTHLANDTVTQSTLEPAKPELSPGGSAFSSLESLTEMAICPVHSGRLNCPKLLPCGHVFCQSCLDKWSQRQSGGQTIECPMCRRTVAQPQAGAADLPTARAHQAILDYLVSHAARHQEKQQQQQSYKTQTQQSIHQRKRSLEMRQDLLMQLSEDFLSRSEEAGSTNAATAFDVAELANVRDNLSRLLQRLEEANRDETVVTEEIESEVDSESADDENEDDEEDATAAPMTAEAAADTFSTTQREMYRMSRYRMRELSLATSEELAAEGFAFAGRIRGEPNGRGRRVAPLVVLLTEASQQLLVIRQSDNRGRMRPTPLNIDWQMRDSWNQGQMRVISLHVARGAIYLSGCRGCSSILAIVSPEDGAVLRCHTREEPTDTAAAEGFGGFHVEPLEAGGGVVAAQPGKRRVEFFGDDLQPTGHWLVFDGLKPRFVAWARQAGTLWVSCPDEGLVLAVNDRTGVFRKLSTCDLFQSTPKHIVAAAASDGECRVVLSDSEQGRLFWIRKRRKYIFLQRLQLSRELPPITGLSTAEDGHLLVTTRDRLFCIKPSRSALTRRLSLRCELL